VSLRADAMSAAASLRRARRAHGSESGEAKAAEKDLAKANRAMRAKPKAKAKPSN
jgi:hypothetical protein